MGAKTFHLKTSAQAASTISFRVCGIIGFWARSSDIIEDSSDFWSFLCHQPRALSCSNGSLGMGQPVRKRPDETHESDVIVDSTISRLRGQLHEDRCPDRYPVLLYRVRPAGIDLQASGQLWLKHTWHVLRLLLLLVGVCIKFRAAERISAAESQGTIRLAM